MAQILGPYFGVTSGQNPKYSAVKKFGRNPSIGTSYEPICNSGFYRRPTDNTSLEFLSSEDDDASDGTGARQIMYEGLQRTSAGLLVRVTGSVDTNGTTPVALEHDLFRLTRWFVTQSGTYSNINGDSHAGTLTIREAGGGDTWSVITIDGNNAKGQSQIGAYTLSSTEAGFIIAAQFSASSQKITDVIITQRQDAHVITAPFSSERILEEVDNIQGSITINSFAPVYIPPCTDIVTYARVQNQTGIVVTDFELIVYDVATGLTGLE